jgi:RimJ/RimL family protein N-acetyltransferase
MANAVVDMLFRDLDADELTSYCPAYNLGANNLAKKAGLKIIFTQFESDWGDNVNYYRITKDQWLTKQLEE